MVLERRALQPRRLRTAAELQGLTPLWRALSKEHWDDPAGAFDDNGKPQSVDLLLDEDINDGDVDLTAAALTLRRVTEACIFNVRRYGLRVYPDDPVHEDLSTDVEKLMSGDMSLGHTPFKARELPKPRPIAELSTRITQLWARTLLMRAKEYGQDTKTGQDSEMSAHQLRLVARWSSGTRRAGALTRGALEIWLQAYWISASRSSGAPALGALELRLEARWSSSWRHPETPGGL